MTSITSILSTATGAMASEQRRLAGIADRLAHCGAGAGTQEDIATPPVESPDEDMVGMIEAARGFEINAAVFETGASLWDMLLAVKRD